MLPNNLSYCPLDTNPLANGAVAAETADVMSFLEADSNAGGVDSNAESDAMLAAQPEEQIGSHSNVHADINRNKMDRNLQAISAVLVASIAA